MSITVENQVKINTEFSDNDILVLNPQYRIRADNGRAIISNPGLPDNLTLGIIPIERAILTALFDGKRRITDVIHTIAYLFDIDELQAKETMARFIQDDRVPLVNLNNIPSGAKIQIYDPAIFAQAGNKFSSDRRLKAPATIVWMPTLRCATKCRYCYMGKRLISQTDMLSDSRIRELIQEMSDLGIFAVNLVGGDPFAHPNIVDYIEMLIAADIAISAATKVPLTKDCISRLSDIGLKELQFSIDGPNAEVCDFLVQTPGWFKGAVETIRMLVEAGIKVQTNTILTSFNIDNADETAIMLSRLGVSRIRLTNYDRSISNHSESFWVPKEKAEKLLARMGALKTQCPDSELIYNIEKDPSEKSQEEKESSWPPPPSCSAYRSNMVIAPDGLCFPTEQIPQLEQYVIGSVRNHTIQEVWDSKKLKDMYYNLPRELFRGTVCYICKDYEKCHFEWNWCFRDAIKAYGTYYAPTPECPKAPKGLKIKGPL